MNSLVNAIKNTVPITQFNRGLAGKIFEDVKKQGAKVVMKNNTPECVLMSPEEYLSLMEADIGSSQIGCSVPEARLALSRQV